MTVAGTSPARDAQNGSDHVNLLTGRIDAALNRAEAASQKLDARHRALREAAGETMAGLDRLIEAMESEETDLATVTGESNG